MEKPTTHPSKVQPRIIIHGGAGSLSRTNLPPALYTSHRHTLLSILHTASSLLPTHSALDVATHAVTLLENNALFNSAHGAVYTSAGTHELEASVMVSRGSIKRGVGVMGLARVKNPILLAREMLIRGEREDGGGARGHVMLCGAEAERLAQRWGIEGCKPGYFWTKKRWDQHRRGLGLGTSREEYERDRREVDGEGEGEGVGYGGAEDDHDWDGVEYVPQGTVGCVVLDKDGVLCVATSTGGITNKLPGRIGDTPTLGAGFWAEQWTAENPFDRPHGMIRQPDLPRGSPLMRLLNGEFGALVRDCLPGVASYLPLMQEEKNDERVMSHPHGRAMSGTGNGDSFLRLSAVRTAAAMTRFSFPPLSLQWSVTRMAGPEGMLQQSAEDRWHKTGEGEGGIIGIEYVLGEGRIVADFNCGGMFRTWIDDDGKPRMMVFRDEY
ncbi:hypothetical protein MBLNU457_4333t1 [Dothideomycetes sp. NU457]